VGYSARYHAISLVAVFLALAIGILIGAEFGGDALNETRRDLERSLTGNLQDERERAEELSGRLARSDEFADQAYPALVGERLSGRRIGLLALGDLPGDVSDSIEEALGPTEGRLVGVGVVREPVDMRAIAGDLSKTRLADIRREEDTLTAFGVGVGRQIVRGGTLLERVRSHLFSRSSGNFGALDGVIVVRDVPEELGTKQRSVAATLESALMAGIEGTRTPAVGVEVSTDETSSISFFNGNDLASVDDVDLTAGQVAMVFALLGAEGSFGVKGTADRLLPDLLAPAGPAQP
jgi:hypothetical protein